MPMPSARPMGLVAIARQIGWAHRTDPVLFGIQAAIEMAAWTTLEFATAEVGDEARAEILDVLVSWWSQEAGHDVLLLVPPHQTEWWETRGPKPITVRPQSSTSLVMSREMLSPTTLVVIIGSILTPTILPLLTHQRGPSVVQLGDGYGRTSTTGASSTVVVPRRSASHTPRHLS